MDLISRYLLPLSVVFPVVFAPIMAILHKKRNIVMIIYSTVSVALLCISAVMLHHAIVAKPIIYQFGNWNHHIGISLLLNTQSGMMQFVLAVALAISCAGFVKNRTLPASATVFSMLTFGGLSGLCFSADFFNTYVFLELASIATYVLLAIGNYNKACYKVAFDYLTIGSVGGIIILLGILMIYVATGTLSMHHVHEIVSKSAESLTLQQIKLLRCGYLTLITGLLLKSGLYPMYSWTVKTYTVSVPTTSSFLSSTVTKVYVFLIYKMNAIFLYNADISYSIERVGHIVSALALFGMIKMGLSNVGERNLRKEISVSSMIQVCYFLLGVFTFNSVVITGVMIQMLVHTISIATMFLVLDPSFYNIDTNYNVKTTRELPKYLLTRSAMTKVGFILLLLSTIGYPVTAGFVGKVLLLDGVFATGDIVSFVLIIVASLIGMIYTWRIIERIMFFEHHHHHVVGTKTLQHKSLRWIMLIAIILTIIIPIIVLHKPFYQIRMNYNHYF